MQIHDVDEWCKLKSVSPSVCPSIRVLMSYAGRGRISCTPAVLADDKCGNPIKGSGRKGFVEKGCSTTYMYNVHSISVEQDIVLSYYILFNRLFIQTVKLKHLRLLAFEFLLTYLTIADHNYSTHELHQFVDFL